MTQLFDSAQLIAELKAFMLSGADAENPVCVGHFQAIIVTAQRCSAEFINRDFPTILTAALRRTDLFGYQDFLSVLLSDWPEVLGREAQFRCIGNFLQRFSDGASDRSRRQILGIFSALSNWLHELSCPIMEPDPEACGRPRAL